MKSQQKDEPQSNKKLLFGLVLFDSKEKSQIEQAIGSILKINYPADKLKIILCSYLSAEKSLNNYVHHANVLLEKFRLPGLKHALYFHGTYINPGWKKEKVATIGNHIFYK